MKKLKGYVETLFTASCLYMHIYRETVYYRQLSPQERERERERERQSPCTENSSSEQSDTDSEAEGTLACSIVDRW